MTNLSMNDVGACAIVISVLSSTTRRDAVTPCAPSHQSPALQPHCHRHGVVKSRQRHHTRCGKGSGNGGGDETLLKVECSESANGAVVHTVHAVIHRIVRDPRFCASSLLHTVELGEGDNTGVSRSVK